MRLLLPTLLALALTPFAAATHDGEPLVAYDACSIQVDGGPVVPCGQLALSLDGGSHPGEEGNSWLFLTASGCAPGAGCAGTP